MITPAYFSVIMIFHSNLLNTPLFKLNHDLSKNVSRVMSYNTAVTVPSKSLSNYFCLASVSLTGMQRQIGIMVLMFEQCILAWDPVTSLVPTAEAL